MQLAYRHLAPKGDTMNVAGRGIRVADIYARYNQGEQPAQSADAYGLPLAAVFEALAYAADHREELRQVLSEDAQAYVSAPAPGPPAPPVHGPRVHAYGPAPSGSRTSSGRHLTLTR